MKIDLLLVTYNRLEYTKLALSSILADSTEEFSLTIWDNASSDGTPDYLKEIRDERIKEVVCSPRNVGQTAALNEIWSKSTADLVGKLDNDCLVTPGWTRKLAKAHADIDDLGVIACWHFFPEDLDHTAARHKIQQFGDHRILRHPWTCGTGLLMKRKTFQSFGPFQDKATTSYWLKLAAAGLINGFYYPPVYQEHMDDLRSAHNVMRREGTVSFEDAYKHTFGWQTGILKDIASYGKIHENILDKLLFGPWEAKYYCGPRWLRTWGRALTLMNKVRFRATGRGRNQSAELHLKESIE